MNPSNSKGAEIALHYVDIGNLILASGLILNEKTNIILINKIKKFSNKIIFLVGGKFDLGSIQLLIKENSENKYNIIKHTEHNQHGFFNLLNRYNQYIFIKNITIKFLLGEKIEDPTYLFIKKKDMIKIENLTCCCINSLDIDYIHNIILNKYHIII